MAGATAGLSSSAGFNYTPTMERSPVYRKKVQHFNEPGHFHELTFSCYKRLPLLTNESWLFLLSDGIGQAMRRHRYLLIAFVYMPEHVHLLVFPQDTASGIDQLLRDIKRPFSYSVKKLLSETSNPLLRRLTVRQRPGVNAFRFWQEGPGYDRNLVTPETASAAAAYIHLNPVRRGLAERELDWRWSSARYWNEPWMEPDPGIPLISPINECLFV